jgi:hypothetical protein
MKKVIKNKNSENPKRKAHSWRPCPLGEHWVITHPYHVRPSRSHPEGSIATQIGHCRKNRSSKDHLYKDDIIEIAQRHFETLSGPPAANNLGFRNRGNKFDGLIRGWTQYWNDVLRPKDPLDPDLVKALIASESGFNPKDWNHRKGDNAAYGLMQVLNKTVQLLKNPKELKDHFVDLGNDDMTDPNFSICAGTRWLFRKKEILEKKVGHLVLWRDVVADYKGTMPNDPKLMPRFDDYYRILKGAKK